MPRIKDPAEALKDKLVESTARFKRGCQRDEETPVFYATDGSRQIRVTSMASVGSQLILFIGEDEEGRHVELLQHFTQASFRMVAIPKEEARPSNSRIGFNDKYLAGEAEGLTDL